MSSENKQIREIFSRIEATLKLRGISKKDFAARIGVLPQQLARYKSQQYPSIEILIRMAVALDVSTDYLLGLNESVNTYPAALKEENIRLRAALQLAIGSMEGAVTTLKSSL